MPIHCQLFSKEGLVALVEYNEKKIFEVKLKEMKSALTTQITEEVDISEVIETVKLRVRDAKLPETEIVRILWDVLMDAVQWSGKNQQQNANAALRQVSFRYFAAMLICICFHRDYFQCYLQPCVLWFLIDMKQMYRKFMFHDLSQVISYSDVLDCNMFTGFGFGFTAFIFPHKNKSSKTKAKTGEHIAVKGSLQVLRIHKLAEYCLTCSERAV